MSGVLRWLEARRWQALAVTLPVVVAIHLSAAAVVIRHSNQDSTASDQGAEIWLAKTSRGDLVPMRTDGVRHPLWSWLARHVFSENDAEFFAGGKWLNTALCAAFLCVLGIAVARWLDPLATANLLLLCSLGIFLVRGTYFQPEPLYYILSFLAGVLAWRVLNGAKPWHYLAFGVVSGLAYLSKPSLLPFLLAFGAAFLLRLALAKKRAESDWKPGRNLAWLAAAFVVFGAMLIPLGRFSSEHFGRPFFNYTKFWMWMDDFETEGWPLQKKYPSGTELKNLPAKETPSLSWYFKRHSFADAWKRGTNGVGEVVIRFIWPEAKLSTKAFFWRSSRDKWHQPLAHRGVYLIALAGLCVVMFLMAGGPALRAAMASGSLAFAVFLVIAIALYAGLYGWYYPIGRGDRFMGSLWLPFVFLLCWWACMLRSMAGKKWADGIYLGMHGVVLISLLVQAAGLFWRFGHGVYLVTRN